MKTLKPLEEVYENVILKKKKLSKIITSGGKGWKHRWSKNGRRLKVIDLVDGVGGNSE